MTRTTWLMGAAAAAGLMAASLQPAAADDAHRGGTMRLLSQSAGGTIDPQINYTLQYWQLYQSSMTVWSPSSMPPGSEGFTIVPDLAEAMPEPQNGGKTYVFKLRKGIKFSNGQRPDRQGCGRLLPAHLQGLDARPPAPSTTASSAPTPA